MVNDREVGDILPISIGTALAIEVLLTGGKPPQADFLFMNIRTLYRNYHGSYKAPYLIAIKDFTNDFIEELKLILDTVEFTITGNVLPVLYTTTGEALKSTMPHAKLKIPSTTLQIKYSKLELYVVTAAAKKLKDKLTVFDLLLEGNNSTSLIISNYPLDLLSYHKFRKLGLLESHTGVIKLKNEWISKLTKNDDYKNLPFNIMTIQILGDGVQIKTIGLKIVKSLIALATDNRWSAATTIAKVKFDLRKLKDPLLKNVLSDMISTKLK